MRNYEPSQGIVEALERDAPGSVFSIWANTGSDLQTARPGVSSWPNPSLSILPGALLGAQDFAFYYPSQVPVRGKDDNLVAPARRLPPDRLDGLSILLIRL